MDKVSDAADIADRAMASGARRLCEVSPKRNCLRWRESKRMNVHIHIEDEDDKFNLNYFMSSLSTLFWILQFNLDRIWISLGEGSLAE